jgi:surface carbohydrate biosynthesis protein
MRFILACDQKWRDLPALTIIALYLKRLGHRAWIMSTKQFESMIPVVQPDCVLLNNFTEPRYLLLARRLRSAGITVAVLPTEGSTPTDRWGRIVGGAFSDFSLLDHHFVWSNEAAQCILAQGVLRQEQVEIVGCPRFDFAVDPFVRYCMTRAEFSQFVDLDPSAPIVCFASRYAISRIGRGGEEQRELYHSRARDVGFTTCLNEHGLSIDDVIDHHTRSLEIFLDAFIFAARARNDVQFVFKPHPNDDVGYLRDRLAEAGLSNARVAVGIYIADVLRASDVLVNADCTTSFEAWIHGLPVVEAQLNPNPMLGRPDIHAGNWLAFDNASVLGRIEDGLARRPIAPETLANRKWLIEKWFYRVDGKRCEAVAWGLDRLMKQRGIARATAGWMLNVPAGRSLRTVVKLKRRDGVMPAGVFDKVITRRDVRRMSRKLAPAIESRAMSA